MDCSTFEIDDRDKEPNKTGHRRGKFRQGWRDAAKGGEEGYQDETLTHLTWQNLGYRLGRLFGTTSEKQIDELYSWCVEQQKSKNASSV